jgi:alpha-beta hydrolase superfamily lysophospholipase
MNNSYKKIVVRIIKIMVLLYGLIGCMLFYAQDYFLFHPTVIERNIPYTFTVPFTEVDLPINNTDTINMVKFLSTIAVTKGVVLYFHGNKGNINRYAKYAANFTSKGYQVWMEDYPGFGKSIGTLNEKKLYQQAAQVYLLAAASFNPDSIIVYGKSFGTGIAAYVASTNKCQQLILETPYYSIPTLFKTFAPMYPTNNMANYKIPTYQYLQKIQQPITIFHGTADGVISYSNAAKLKDVLKPSDKFITIPQGTHHNINTFALYHTILDSLIR